MIGRSRTRSSSLEASTKPSRPDSARRTTLQRSTRTHLGDALHDP
jgi:hypothetical protein